MNELFDKTYEELRENFVRARFGEEQVFGREDIEEWLEGQRSFTSPDQKEWDRIACCGSNTQLLYEKINNLVSLEDLKNHVTTFSAGELEEFVREGDFHDKMGAFFTRLLSRLYPEERTFFYPFPGLFHVTGSGFADVSFTSGSRTILGVSRPKEDAVSRRLMYEWREGLAKVDVSRSVICDALAEVIAEVRAKAEEDFDKAVACSADGRRIVHADEVWIFKQGSLERKIIQEVPSDQKLLLDTKVYEGSWNLHSSSDQDWKMILAHRQAHRKHGMNILPLPRIQQIRKRFSDKTVFWTDVSYVPDALLSSNP